MAGAVIGERNAGVQNGIFHVAVGAAVKLVGPALQHRHYCAAAGIAVRRRGIRGDYLDLANRIPRRVVADQVVLPFVQIDAIQGVVIACCDYGGENRKWQS